MPNDRSSEDKAPHEVPAPRAWSWSRFARNALVIGLTVGGAVWFWDQSLAPNLFPKNFGVVVEGAVYRSGELTPAATRRVVRAHGIRTIVDLGAHEPGTPEEARAQATADALGVERVALDLSGDATGDPNHYVTVLRIMASEARQPVLVHCAAGSERTGCAVAMYRHIYQSIPQQDAVLEAQEHKHNPNKNPLLTPTFERWVNAVRRSIETGERIEWSREQDLQLMRSVGLAPDADGNWSR
ncbi:MAG: tyrosine-protein phosphatase [Planctomycetota bacterium]